MELRGWSSDGSIGLQTVVPPSIHVTGEPIRFEDGFDGTPANIDADTLVSAVRKVAATALLSRHWPTQGSRHKAFLALAGVLARGDWSLEDAKRLHRSIYRCLWQKNADLRAAESEVQSTFEKHSSGGEITGIPTLIGVLEKKVVDTALDGSASSSRRAPIIYGTTRATLSVCRLVWARDALLRRPEKLLRLDRAAVAI